MADIEVPIKHVKVNLLPDGTDPDVVLPSEWNENHKITGPLPVTELRLIPKVSSSGAEGTIFYDSVDKCVYVGVEV